jgi:hypothetical protein
VIHSLHLEHLGTLERDIRLLSSKKLALDEDIKCSKQICTVGELPTARVARLHRHTTTCARNPPAACIIVLASGERSSATARVAHWRRRRWAHIIVKFEV